jgi:hypothetical protein
MIATKFPLAAIVTAAMFLSSCGGNEQKTTTEEPAKDTTTTTAAPSETVAPSTIVTTPQIMIVVRHKVKDYEKWKVGYEGHDSVRMKYGIHNYVLGRGVKDSNMVLVALKADDLEKVNTFYKDGSLKVVMQKAGVLGAPIRGITTAVFQDTAKINSDLRSMTTFKVKSWAQWQKGFAEGKQERMDNGIVERVIGHDPADSNKVTLVTAIMDTAKASAYWSSDMLKKRREASGVIGTPERFIFRVVHRY